MATAYFAFKDAGEDEFVFELHDNVLIAHARKIVSGEEKQKVSVMGKIVKSKKWYNERWDYHLNPENIEFFEVAVEVCDAAISYVNDHLDEACKEFLPNCIWCPWSSKVTREVQFPRPENNS